MLAIVDSGGANIGSVRFALNRLGVESSLTSDFSTIRNASHVILPGVGAAAAAMRKLAENGLDALIPTLTQPVIGICLGLQLLYESSEEGDVGCLGIIPGTARRFSGGPGLRVPHMGWNRLEVSNPDPLVANLGEDAYAYFVHSYAIPVSSHTVATSEHGEPFTAIARRDNFCAAQFHPERSADTGSKILENFLRAV